MKPRPHLTDDPDLSKSPPACYPSRIRIYSLAPGIPTFLLIFVSLFLLPLLDPNVALAQTGTDEKTTVSVLGGVMLLGDFENRLPDRYGAGVRVSHHLFLDQSLYGEVMYARSTSQLRRVSSVNITMANIGFASNLISRNYTGSVGLYVLFGLGLIAQDLQFENQYIGTHNSERSIKGLAAASTVLELGLSPSVFLRLNGSIYGSYGNGGLGFPGLALLGGLAVDL